MNIPVIEPGGTTRDRRGLSRFVARVKAALTSNSKPRASVLPTTAPTEVATIATIETPGVVATGHTASAPEVALESQSWHDPTQPLSPDSCPEIDESNAEALGDEYTVDAGSTGWRKAPLADRMEKKIRMRVHHSCHKCSTTYGVNMICSSCDHVRCKMCPRYPPKRPSTADNGESTDGIEDDIVVGASSRNLRHRKDKYQVTKPSKTGGQPLVRKKVKQRVRRTCHLCETLFQPDDKSCAKCNHERCALCPRQPPHVNTYPHGYSGDITPPSESSTSRPPRLIFRYRCHNCSTIIEAGETSCGSCKHKKCVDCKRVRPKKVKPDADPDLAKKVEARIAALGLDQSQSPAEEEPS